MSEQCFYCNEKPATLVASISSGATYATEYEHQARLMASLTVVDKNYITLCESCAKRKGFKW